MAGHSKWNNIKNRKAAADATKGKVFGQLARQIRVAVKEHNSGDPQMNSTLRTMLEKARAENMPKDKIQRAIDAGLGKGGAGEAKEIVYEGFGPGGVGFLVVAVTDNSNRTTGEVKNIFSSAGGSLGSPNSVKYMFARAADGGYTPTIPFAIEAPEQQEKIQNLIDELRSNEDVEEVFCAGEWPEKE